MKKLGELTREELIEIADLFLDQVHSDGFKSAEAKTLLTDKDYWFLGNPKPNWKQDITNYLTAKGYELPITKLFISN